MKFKDSDFIIKELYPLVESKLSQNSISRNFIANISNFFNAKNTQIYDIAPYKNIYFNQSDVNNLFKSINIDEKEVEDILKKCFFWNENYRPKCAKEPYVQVLMCSIRYYLKNNESLKAEQVTIYTCFSGKFYASLYSNLWRFPVTDSIMDYVINNMLSDKYDLKKEGNMFKAIRKMAKTWLDKYEKNITAAKISDDEINKILIQQLRDREKSFLTNIYLSYKDAVENKTYLNFETDNLDPEAFRITDNDSAKASRITEAAIGILTSNKVSMQYCNNAADSRVKPHQIKSILENIILSDKNNIPSLRRVINIMICDYMAAKNNRPINSIEFLSYCITAKPNTKNELILEMKQTIKNWLAQDDLYRKRCGNAATDNSYYRSILSYLGQVIIVAAGRQ